jgi:hypothetical protein
MGWMSLLRLSKAVVGLLEVMAKRSRSTRLDIPATATLSLCIILLYRSHRF